MASVKYKWIDSFSWFNKLWRVWTKELCYEEAKKYRTKSEFRKNNISAYNTAIKNKWLENYTWFINGNKLRWDKDRKWTYELVKSEAIKYKTKSEFKRENPRAYYASIKYKWIDSFSWFSKSQSGVYLDKVDSVYAYEFKEQNAVYIGRTLMRLQKQRDYQHIFSNDSVARFAKSNNTVIPEMKILEENLTIKEGSEMEGIWLERYKSGGWNIINTAKTGSLGWIGKGKWNYENTKKEAQKYKTINEFRKASPSAYSSALRNKWIDSFNWLVRKIHLKWTYESAKSESIKYKSRSDFARNSSAYDASLRNNWLDEFFPKINNKNSGNDERN